MLFSLAIYDPHTILCLHKSSLPNLQYYCPYWSDFTLDIITDKTHF